MSWPKFWQQSGWQTKLLWPLSKLVCWEAHRRFKGFLKHPPPRRSNAVLLVVGNLVVGGSGKTPFIVWLVKQLQAKQLRVGVISRGYGGKAQYWPQMVSAQSAAHLVGDEPVLLAKQLQCPIAVSPIRADAVALLEQQHPLDVIISDDGLQHYGLARDIEVVLVDGQRLWGNGLCLPAGPLRESIARLDWVDFIVYNGAHAELKTTQSNAWRHKSYTMRLQPVCFHQVFNPENTLPINAFIGQKVNAMAGIGNPQRFFDTLASLSMLSDNTQFKDHFAFSEQDFKFFGASKPLIMTEKDAVKCTEFAFDKTLKKPKDWWYLEVQPQADVALFELLYQHIQAKLPTPK